MQFKGKVAFVFWYIQHYRTSEPEIEVPKLNRDCMNGVSISNTGNTVDREIFVVKIFFLPVAQAAKIKHAKNCYARVKYSPPGQVVKIKCVIISYVNKSYAKISPSMVSHYV